MWRLIVDLADATALDHVVAAVGEQCEAISAFENGKAWRVEGMSQDKPDAALLDAALVLLGISPAVVVERLQPRDWVSENQAGFPPLRAGRFFIHGSHYQVAAPRDAIPILIDAATAFGTGEHATTRGCLLATALVKSRPRRILDMGCGTGILAIAATKLWRRDVLATDIDPDAAPDANGPGSRACPCAGRRRDPVGPAGAARGRGPVGASHARSPFCRTNRARRLAYACRRQPRNRMTGLQALITAILQGLTELFPVSSLGHAVILPRLLGWGFSQSDPSFLPFLVVLHLGTAAALLLYFWRDWAEIIGAFFGVGTAKERRERWRLLWLIVVATIPAVILGGGLEKYLRHLFGAPEIAAAFLMVNGVILFTAERLRRRSAGLRVATEMSWRTAIVIGLWQSLALIPGISRSGTTMVGGLLGGLHHKEAARFSFLIATPIILGAAVLEVPHFFQHQAESGGFGPLVWLAGIVAGITAYASTAFLMRYFGRHDFEALDPFAYYCVAAGAVALLLFRFVL